MILQDASELYLAEVSINKALRKQIKRLEAENDRLRDLIAKHDALEFKRANPELYNRLLKSPLLRPYLET